MSEEGIIKGGATPPLSLLFFLLTEVDNVLIMKGVAIMREIGKTEIFRFKCPICGSLNKKYIPISYKHYQYGYALHCCNCGKVYEFIKPPKSIGGLYNGQFMIGEVDTQRCYMLNECKHADCPLYGSYKPDEGSGYDDEIGDSHDPNEPNPPEDDKTIHLGVYENLNDNELKLNVVTKDKPQFV